MGRKRGVILVLIMLVLFATLVSAKSMKLLAVSKTKEGLAGTSADLELEINEGSGRVFISTFPLTNVDTQISFRMAKEYACDFLDRDCANYDFYYVIRSDSPIIGGPSAGGAATLLTISTLDNLNLNQDVAATGTINSGGIIGPVAGVKQKLEAASKIGLKKVIIPAGARYYQETNEEMAQKLNESANLNLTAAEILNKTIDLVEYGRKLGLEVMEVEDISQAIFELTGKKYKSFDETVQMDEKYQTTMKSIAEKLCNRSTALLERLTPAQILEYQNIIRSADNLTQSGAKAYQEGYYYSTASYCYGANVKYDYITLLTQNLSSEELAEKLDLVENETNSLNKKLEDFEYKTIDDMQTFLVVKERLTEAQHYTQEARQAGSRTDALYSLSLAVERVYSAYYWSEFFGKGGKTFNIEEGALARFCLDKISEADERIQYISNFILLPMDSIKEELDAAMADYQAKDYELCIFKASKVKARTNLILNSIGLRNEDFERVLARKIEIAREVIVKETKRKIFPILGYSYYEYARSLQEEDPSSAMLYTELSLELGNFDMYFEPEKTPRNLNIDTNFIIIFGGGALSGFLTATVIYILLTRKIGFRRRRKPKLILKKLRTKG